VTWSSSNSAVLSISAAGVATAGNVTSTTTVSVTARLGLLSSNLALNVLPQSSITGLQVRPTSSSIAKGTAESHSAIVLFSDGTQQDVTAQAIWSVAPSVYATFRNKAAPGTTKHASSEPQPADATTGAITVNHSGVDYASQAGASNVQATYGSMQAQSVVLVTNATVKSIAISSPDLLIPVTAQQQFTH
jgi:hypothetical protein